MLGEGGGGVWSIYPAGTFVVGPNITDVYDTATLPSPLQLKLRDIGEVSMSQLGDGGWTSALNYKTLIIDIDITKTGTYTIPASQEIIFKSKTVSQDDNLAAFEAPNPFWKISGNGKIERLGAAPVAEIAGSIGISVLQGSIAHNISGNIEVSNFAQAGVVFNGGGVLTGDVSMASTVGLRCLGNWNNIEFLDGFSSEYHSLSNVWSFHSINDGVLLESGNITWNGGGSVSSGGANIHLRHPAAGGNPHHGVFNGALINHGTTYAVWADKVNAGHMFNSCTFFDNFDKNTGRIRLDNCRSVTFNGGMLSCAVEYIDDGSHIHRGYNYITGMDVRTGVTVDDPTKLIMRDKSYMASGTWELNDTERFNVTKRTNSDVVISGFSSYNLMEKFDFSVVDNRDAVSATFGTVIMPYAVDVVSDIDAVIYLSTAVSVASVLHLKIDVSQTGSYTTLKTFQVQPMADPTGLIVHLKASYTANMPKDSQVAWFLEYREMLAIIRLKD